MPDDVMRRPAVPPALRANFAPGTWNADNRTIDVTWSTGARVARRDYWENTNWTEVLDVSPDAVDLARMNAGAPVLNTHSSYDLSDVIGVVERAWIENGLGRATVRFSDRPEVASIMRDVGNGIIRNLSVGYTVQQWDVVPAGDGTGEVRTAKRWTPYEISFVPIPADAGAQTRALAPTDTAMPAPQPQAARAAPQEPSMPDPVLETATATAAATTAERARVSAINGLQRQHPQITAEFVQTHIEAGTSIDAVRGLVLDLLAAAAPRPVAQMVRDEAETRGMLLQNALEHRAHIPGVALIDGAREFRGLRLLDIARVSIEAAGASHRGMSPLETFERALGLHRRDLAGAMSTSDFSNLLANTASKSLRIAYGTAPRTFTQWTTQHDLPDFKQFSVVQLGGAPKLTAIAQGGVDEYSLMTDAAEKWNLIRVGKLLAITFEAMVNDDLSGFTRIPAMFGAAAARYESETVYGLLETNAAMSDGITLFHASHNNLATGGSSALTVDATGVLAVGKLQQYLRKQTAPNGDVLNNTLRYLVVPAELETAARQLFSSRLVPSSAGAVNPFSGGDGPPVTNPHADSSINVISEGRLAASATAFYGIADPAQIDTVQWGYLQGEAGPRVSTELDFDTDGMKTKVVHIFGAKIICMFIV